MAKYRLTVGKHTTRDTRGNVKRHKVGDLVELTNAAAETFKERFEPVDAAAKRRKKAKVVAEASAKIDAEPDGDDEPAEDDSDKSDEGGGE